MRIALATVGTTGDVRPFVVLGSALLDAGHEVRAVTWPVHVEAFRAAGIPVDPAGERIAAAAETVATDPATRTRTRALAARMAAERGPEAAIHLLTTAVLS
jgi:hypothetical protein